ncbi:hypothetical protein RJT34_17398 [Clitoria ternatea]|uniref:GDSL esterase/lipase 1-like n=1 Tax=Clitoria ternatea TaxID=43366 RepID=A0AAN9JA66_CLITE
MASLIYLLVFTLIQMTQIECSMVNCLPKNHAALFILGDSLFDNGNNNYINTTMDYQANYPPFGETFFKYPSGRFSDGRMIPDVVAELAQLPLLPPYLHPGHPQHIYGVNFASGGSGALRETALGFVIDLKTQVSYLRNVKNNFRQRLGVAEAEELVSKSVYLFSVGANDYGAILDLNTGLLPPGDHKNYVDNVIGNITEAIKEIYNFGGKKFGFVNVPGIGCSPGIRWAVNNGSTGPCYEGISAIARLHNSELTKMLQKLEKQLRGFKYSITDFYSAFAQLITYPSRYGLKEVSGGCCGGGAYKGDGSCGMMKNGKKEYELCDNVNEYLFFDSHHPTDRASQIFAELIWNGNLTVTKPYNLKQLFQL